MLRLPGVRTSFPSGALAPTEADRAEMAASRVRRRVYDIMATAAAAPQPECACCPESSCGCGMVLLFLLPPQPACSVQTDLIDLLCESCTTPEFRLSASFVQQSCAPLPGSLSCFLLANCSIA